jgi:hypothetical protein
MAPPRSLQLVNSGDGMDTEPVLALESLSTSKRLAVAEFVHFTYRGITSCRKRSAPKIEDIQTTLSGTGSRSTDSILAMESCARTTGSSN